MSTTVKGGIGGESFLASDVLETDEALLAELAFGGAAAPTAEDDAILETELGIPAEKLAMYDADTIVALYAVSRAMQAVKNGTATEDQVALLKKADSFLDQLYICCTGNGVANDGTLTVGMIQSFKNFLAELESRNAEGDVPVGPASVLTADDIAEMADGFNTENTGGVYVTDENDVTAGVFDAAPIGAVPFPGFNSGATGYPAQPLARTATPAADAVDTPPTGGAAEGVQADDEAEADEGGGKVAHDHDGDGVRDHA